LIPEHNSNNIIVALLFVGKGGKEDGRKMNILQFPVAVNPTLDLNYQINWKKCFKK